jgi:hypothetical protein
MANELVELIKHAQHAWEQNLPTGLWRLNRMPQIHNTAAHFVPNIPGYFAGGGRGYTVERMGFLCG